MLRLLAAISLAAASVSSAAPTGNAMVDPPRTYGASIEKDF